MTAERVLVTGAAGFIGRHAVADALANGDQVLGVDNFSTGERNGLPGEFMEIDVREEEFVQVAARFRPDCIYHLACPTGVPNLEPLAYDMLSTSYQGTLNVIRAARASKARVVVASSAEVYGNPTVSPQPESYTGNVDPQGPRSGYEEGKRVAETLATIAARQWGVRVAIARIFNTYGEGMRLDEPRVVASFVRSAIEGRPIHVFGDGSQTRCHCHVSDTLGGLRAVLNDGKPGRAYNLGSSIPLSVHELASLIVRLANSNSRIERVPHPYADHDQRLPDTSRAFRELGWEPRVSLRDGLTSTIADFRARMEAQAGTADGFSAPVAAG